MLHLKRPTRHDRIPLSFNTKKPDWPDPELSIDVECLGIDGLRCWQVKGPALAVIEVLGKPLAEILAKNCESLEQGEPKPRALSFHMWMIGKTPESAHPTIVFSSKSRRQRSYAKALLKESHLLDQHPGVRIKTLDKVPARFCAEASSVVPSATVAEGVYMIDGSKGACGALVAFGQTRLATMGGVLLIDDHECGISVQHPRWQTSQELSREPGVTALPFFDYDSEDEDLGMMEITSRGIILGEHDDSLQTSRLIGRN